MELSEGFFEGIETWSSYEYAEKLDAYCEYLLSRDEEHKVIGDESDYIDFDAYLRD